MNKVVFITPRDAAPGFSLAGVAQYVAGPAELEGVLKELTREGNYGLIGIDERLLNEELEEIIALRQEAWAGVIIILPPPPRQATVGAGYAERLLQKAIGYQVRLNV
jgi:vacuolar-type H+-ATPase subunit F/Vma7